nr:MAG TPA: hypothetical protein [Caudoviricetes sp.]
MFEERINRIRGYYYPLIFCCSINLYKGILSL